MGEPPKVEPPNSKAAIKPGKITTLLTQAQINWGAAVDAFRDKRRISADCLGLDHGGVIMRLSGITDGRFKYFSSMILMFVLQPFATLKMAMLIISDRRGELVRLGFNGKIQYP